MFSGNTDATSIRTEVENVCADATRKAGIFAICYGGNIPDWTYLDAPLSGGGVIACMQSSVATVGDPSRVYHYPMYNREADFNSIEVVATTKQRLKRFAEGSWPTTTIDYNWPYVTTPVFTAADQRIQGYQGLVPSLTHGSHSVDYAYEFVFKRMMEPVFRAEAGGIPLVSDGRRIFSRAATAQTNGGFVADMPLNHSLEGTTLSTTSTDFAFAVYADKTIRITRASGVQLLNKYDAVPLTLTKTVGGVLQSHTVNLRISIGNLTAKTSAPVPSLVNWGGGYINGRPSFSKTLVPALTKMSLAFGIKTSSLASIDANGSYPLFGDNSTTNGLFIQKAAAGGNIRVILKDANNVTIASVTSTATPLLNSAGFNWIFVEFDTTLGASSYLKISVNETAATTTTFTGGTSVAAQNFAAWNTALVGNTNVSTPANPLVGCGPFMWDDVIGFTDATVGASKRAILRNPASPMVPLAQSAGCAIDAKTPILAFIGNAADMYNGAADGQMNAANFGSLGDMFHADYGTLTTYTASPVTLGTLTLATALGYAGAQYRVMILNRTIGSTITATSSDGSPVSISGDTLTVTFPATGLPVLTLTETLAGASNSGKVSTFRVSVQPARFTLQTLGTTYSAPIVGVSFTTPLTNAASGSLVLATSSDGTVLEVYQGALIGTFATTGSKTITMTEYIDGGVGQPFVSTVTLNVLAELPALSFVDTTAKMAVPTTFKLANKTPGSTITATSSDGTALLVSGVNITGTFMTVSTPTITVVETLAGATNSPKTSTIGISVVASKSAKINLTGTGQTLAPSDWNNLLATTTSLALNQVDTITSGWTATVGNGSTIIVTGNGPTNIGLYPNTVTQPQWYHANPVSPLPTITVSGLNNAKTYKVTVWASRNGVTAFTIGGQTLNLDQTGTLPNTTTVVFGSVAPSSGSFTFSFKPTLMPDGVTMSGNGFAGSLIIEEL
jgi:hypothetical protein